MRMKFSVSSICQHRFVFNKFHFRFLLLFLYTFIYNYGRFLCIEYFYSGMYVWIKMVDKMLLMNKQLSRHAINGGRNTKRDFFYFNTNM